MYIYILYRYTYIYIYIYTYIYTYIYIYFILPNTTSALGSLFVSPLIRPQAEITWASISLALAMLPPELQEPSRKFLGFMGIHHDFTMNLWSMTMNMV